MHTVFLQRRAFKLFLFLLSSPHHLDGMSEWVSEGEYDSFSCHYLSVKINKKILTLLKRNRLNIKRESKKRDWKERILLLIKTRQRLGQNGSLTMPTCTSLIFNPTNISSDSILIKQGAHTLSPHATSPVLSSSVSSNNVTWTSPFKYLMDKM